MLQSLEGIRVNVSIPLPSYISVVKNRQNHRLVEAFSCSHGKRDSQAPTNTKFPRDLVHYVLNMVVKTQVPEAYIDFCKYLSITTSRYLKESDSVKGDPLQNKIALSSFFSLWCEP